MYEAGVMPMCEVFKATGKRRLSGCVVETGADVAGCGGGCNEGAHFPRCYGAWWHGAGWPAHWWWARAAARF